MPETSILGWPNHFPCYKCGREARRLWSVYYRSAYECMDYECNHQFDLIVEVKDASQTRFSPNI